MPERVFNLPDLGEGLEDAELVDWKVAEGDVVELNQPLVEVNTAKALVEIPSPVAGRIATLHGQAGDVIEVGKPLVTFEVEEGAPPSAEGEAAAAAGQQTKSGDGQGKREAVLVGYGVGEETGGARNRPRLRPPGPRRAPAATAAEHVVPTGPPPPPGAGPSTSARATPPVRRLAREQGVDLNAIQGTGPEGRITREDVLSAASAGPSAAPQVAPPGEDHTISVRGVRRLIAEKMTRSWREIPHVTTYHTADATYVEELRHELTSETGIKISALSIVARALAKVCRAHPLLNSSWQGEEILLRGPIHMGIATDTERGLMVPVVRDADRKGITQLAQEIAEVVDAAREGRATPEQLTGSTITISNVGTFGSNSGTPIINMPEAAILALGRIEQRPLVVDGDVVARPVVTLSLSFDHRVLDGADADRAMSDLRKTLESPFRLGALPR